MFYTVKKLADLSGVSVRTLHYYDEIGLLAPKEVKDNGYRVYGGQELLRLQQILFFKELDFSLKEVKEILASDDFEALVVLKDQLKMLEMKKQRFAELIESVGKSIEVLERGEELVVGDLYGSFSVVEMEKYKEEARERWGNCEAFKESEKRMKDWGKGDYDRLAEEGKAIVKEIAAVMEMGERSEVVQGLVKKYHEHMGSFYDCKLEIFAGLGKMYGEDERFSAYFEEIEPGLSSFMSEAIRIYCESS